MKRLFAFFTLIFCSLPPCFASQNEAFRLNSNTGLSNSSINVEYIDNLGRLWLGTWDGLNRYDGRQIKVYRQIPGDERSISNNVIRAICQQRSGELWIATERGVDRLSPTTDDFTRCLGGENASTGVYERSFCVCVDSNDRVYASQSEKGIYLYNEDSQEFERIVSLDGRSASYIAADFEDGIWALGKDGRLLYIYYDPQTDEYGSEIENLILRSFSLSQDKRTIYGQTPEGLYLRIDAHSKKVTAQYSIPKSLGNINTSLINYSGHLVGSSSGLYSFDEDKGEFTPQFLDAPVLSLCTDRQDMLWVGTDMSGAVGVRAGLQNFKSVSMSGSFAVRCFAEDELGRLWVGSKGGGISVMSKEGIEASYNLSDNNVYSLLNDGKAIWIGTDGKGLEYRPLGKNRVERLTLPPEVDLRSVYAILPDGADTLYVGTSGYGLFKLVINRSTRPWSIDSYKQYLYKSSGIGGNVIYSIVGDDNGHLYIGTRGGGLNLFDKETEEFTSVPLPGAGGSEQGADDIVCLSLDGDGHLWVGTSMGLYRVGTDALGDALWVSERSDIPNNTIHGILSDEENAIWFSTNNGLGKILCDENFRTVIYNSKDGLQSNEFADGAFYKRASTGDFYFGGIGGYTQFAPNHVLSSTFFPSLALEDFLVDNSSAKLCSYSKDGRLVLDHRVKSVSLTFSAVDLYSSAKCEFAYILEGFNKDWIELGTSGTVVLSNIKPGNYTLRVKCSNADKIWSEESFALPLKVRPPWQRSVWAYIAYAILLLCLVLFVFYMLRREAARRQAETVHEAKLDFFTNIAHEFSNSLTLIYGPSEDLLSDDKIPSAEKKTLRVINANADRLQRLIGQLISFRKAETGHLAIKAELVDLGDLVREESEYYREGFAQKDIEFSINIEPYELKWPTDRDSLEKILFNFLSNALKYTPQGGKISLSIRSEQDLLHLSVRNTGKGLKKEQQKVVFDRYTVLNKFEKDLIKGKVSNGIGTSLCKSLAELLGGEIGIESDESSYTTFFVRLPRLEITEPPKIEPLANSAENPLLPKVLIVDDDPNIREYICNLLRDQYSVSQADNGRDALEKISKETPQLIISDYVMPVLDGIGLLKTLRADQLTRHIPVILLTALNMVESQIIGAENGADAYIGKPFKPRQLMATISNLLKREKNLLEYSSSSVAALEQYNDKLVKKEDRELMLKTTDYILKNISKEDLSLDELCERLALSRMQLYRKIKELTGLSPSEYLRELRLQRAASLLRSTNGTISEIMYSCGFQNKSYFYREFGKAYGCTPKSYRDGACPTKR